MLIAQGTILRVRKCMQCKTWFFAGRSDQKFCKPSCQRKFLESSAEFKANRRKYMRDYYEKQTRRNVK